MEKWPFLDQKYSLLKNVIFWTFLTSCFYSVERRFFGLEYRKRHFPGLHCLKKTTWKNGHFFTKTMEKPKTLWKNVNFLTFWTCCFFSLERRFLGLENRKRHFPGLFCLKKKNRLEKWPFLDQNHDFEKCQFFRLFELLFFIA